MNNVEEGMFRCRDFRVSKSANTVNRAHTIETEEPIAVNTDKADLSLLP